MAKPRGRSGTHAEGDYTSRALTSGKTSKRCPEGLRSVLPRNDTHVAILLTLLKSL